MRLPLPKDWPLLFLASCVALSITFLGSFFFLRSRTIMESLLRQRLESAAASAALFIDGDSLDQIHQSSDETKPVFIDLVHRLNSLRTLQGIRYAYIMRKTTDPQQLTFVADADTLDTKDQLDINHDGVIEPSEQPSHPGEYYSIVGSPAMGLAFTTGPTTDPSVTYDQWGAFISGYAPIHSKDGTVVAIIGIDMTADQFASTSQSGFTPIALMLFIIAGTAIAWTIVILWQRRQSIIQNRIDTERSGLMRMTFHQLGEPLTIMKWSLESLRESINDPELIKAVEEHVKSMDDGLGRLNSIIDTLQQAEKVDLNTLSYVPEKSSLKELIDNSVREWLSSAESRKQKIEVYLSSDLNFLFDHNMIHLVLRQLLQNAIEYSPEGGIITLRVQPDKEFVTISVDDHGCGIPPEEIEHIFEKYHRATNAPHIKPDGNGLGLYIAKGIVERAGGQMWIESIEGSATKVSFTLPIKS